MSASEKGVMLTYSGSPYINQLKTGRIINVERRTTVKIFT